MIFSKKKKGTELVAVFDFGSGSVGGALVLLPPGRHDSPPIMVASHRISFGALEKISGSRMEDAMIQTLSNMAAEVFKSTSVKIKKIYCFLNSPWYASQLRIIKYGKNTPFVMSGKLAGNLLEKEMKSFKNSDLKKFGSRENPAIVFDFKNIGVKLNGYKTVNPIGKRAREAEFAVHVSMAPEKLISSATAAIRRHSHAPIEYHSYGLAAFAVGRDALEMNDSFLALSVGDEVTDIALVKDGIIREDVSFPFGKNDIMRAAGDPAEFSLYLRGRASIMLRKRIEGRIRPELKNWLKKFQSALSDLGRDMTLPSEIFITVDKDIGKLYLQIIKDEELAQHMLTKAKFNVILLGATALHRNIKFPPNVGADNYLMIESIFINSLK